MSLGRPYWKEARATIQHLLSKDVATLRDNDELRREAFVPQADVTVRD
jgi:fumarylacetoacetase